MTLRTGVIVEKKLCLPSEQYITKYQNRKKVVLNCSNISGFAIDLFLIKIAYLVSIGDFFQKHL